MSITTTAAADHVIALIDGALEDREISWDAMRWSPAPAVPAEVGVGDVVEYHGSMRAEHGEYVVVALERGRLVLCNHYYPSTARLADVRRISVTPTGERVPVCECRHPLTHPVLPPTGACPHIACRCPLHP